MFSQMKLGKLAPRHDPRTLLFARYLDLAALPPLPASTSYRAAVSAWPMLKNDAVGDCAIAAPLHQLQAWIDNDKGSFTPTDEQAIAAYSAVSGYDPKTGANDNGCVMLDVMRYWQRTGIGGHKIGPYAKLTQQDANQLRASVHLFGGSLLGVSLPLAWQSAKDWQAPITTPTGNWVPGSWGGHAIHAVDYDDKWIYVVTWGTIVRMSWHAYSVYADEAWVAFSPDWFGPDGSAPNGFDWNALAADFTALTGQPAPPAPAPAPPPAPPKPPTPPPGPVVGSVSVVTDLAAKTISVNAPGFTIFNTTPR